MSRYIELSLLIWPKLIIKLAIIMNRKTKLPNEMPGIPEAYPFRIKENANQNANRLDTIYALS